MSKAIILISKIILFLSIILVSNCNKKGKEVKPYYNVQTRLNMGEERPIDIYRDNQNLLDSLYGKYYQGGLIFYLDVVTGKGLVVTSTNFPQTIWGCYGTNISGAQDESIGSGAKNTSQIILECSEENIAARVCSEYVVQGYDDWFLPSRNELKEIWDKIKYLDTGDEFVNGIGYWSSTQLTSTLAFAQDLSSGYQANGNGKTDLYFIRAVRAFP